MGKVEMYGAPLVAVVADVVKHLPGYALKAPGPDGYGCSVWANGQGGRGLFFGGQTIAPPGRLQVSGLYLSDRSNNVAFGPPDAPSITVDAARAPAEIAADISRRLLPAYALAFAKSEEMRANYEAYRARVEALKVRMVNAGAELPRGQHGDGDRLRLPGFCDVVVGDGSVRFERLDGVPADMAERIVRILAAL